MASERDRRHPDIDDTDRQIAATLAAALIARGFNMPAAANTTMAAAQAVAIYRLVLDQLRTTDETPHADSGAGMPEE